MKSVPDLPTPNKLGLPVVVKNILLMEEAQHKGNVRASHPVVLVSTLTAGKIQAPKSFMTGMF